MFMEHDDSSNKILLEFLALTVQAIPPIPSWPIEELIVKSRGRRFIQCGHTGEQKKIRRSSDYLPKSIIGRRFRLRLIYFYV